MFETNSLSKIVNPLARFDESHLWSAVSLRIHLPWFYVVLSNGDVDGLERVDMLFVSNVNDLIDMRRDLSVQVLQAYLVSPGHLNESDKWKMEEISHIKSGLEPERDQLAYVYELENGHRYIESALGSKEADLRDIDTIYAAVSS